MNRAQRRQQEKAQTQSAKQLPQIAQQALQAFHDKRFNEAHELCKQSTPLGQHPDILYVFGELCIMTNNMQEAINYFSAAIKLDERHALSLYGLGRALEGVNPAQALECFQAVLQHDPNHTGALEQLAVMSVKAKQWAQAWQFRKRVVELDYNNLSAWMRLCFVIEHDRHAVDDPTIDKLLIKALDESSAERRNLMAAWMFLLQAKPGWKALRTALKSEALPAAEAWQVVNSAEARYMLQHFAVNTVEGEWVYGMLRRRLLQAASTDAISQEDAIAYIPLIEAMAAQCRFNDYVWMIDETEAQQANALRSQLMQGEVSSDDMLAIFKMLLIGCYEDIRHDTELAEHLEASAKTNPILSRYLSDALDEWRTEQAIKDQIDSFAPIADDVSQKVQAQYETHPYPRWKKMVLPTPKPLAEQMKIAYDMPGMDASKVPSKPTLLVAGCGTGGHAINCARFYKNVQVTAIDLSRDSLAYGQRMADEMGIDNVTFKHGDILDVAQLGETFDVIEVVGVLHHMKEPEKGLVALTEILNPNGIMHLGLYSRAARQSITALRDYIAQQNIPSTAQGMRELRALVMDDLSSPHHAAVTNMLDFYSMPECRDLLFHEQEHCYDILEIKHMTEKNGLNFVAMEAYDRGLYDKVTAFHQGDKSSLSSLEKWHEYEQAHPNTFINMIVMWLCKPAS